MALFNFRKKAAQPLKVNVYTNSVTEPVTFDQLTFEQLEELYEALADIRIIEDFISDNVAKIPVEVVSQRGTTRKGSELNTLIEQTNTSQIWAEFIKESLIFYGLTGNSFIYRTPETGFLYTLPTSKTTITLGLDKTIPEFLNYVAGYWLEQGGKQYPFQETDIFHLKTSQLASENGLWSLGSSPYMAGGPNVEALNANYSSRVSTLRDRGAMGVLSNESEIPDIEESRLIKEKLGTDYGTQKDQDKLIVTTQKLNYQQIALGLSELKFLDNLDLDFSRLCELRGLDPLLFSSQDTTYANQEQARKAAINNVIVPLADKWYAKFNEFIRPYYGGDKIQPLYDELPEYGSINKDLSDKLINEAKAGIITNEQAFEQLYPDGQFIEPEPVEPEPMEETEETE